MTKKIAVWGYLIVLSFATVLNLYMPKTEAAEKESIVIPADAIRLRILANSDLEQDQAIKLKVRDAVNAQITTWVKDLTSLEKARVIINSKLPEILQIAERVVREQGSNQSVKVEYGKVKFPTKLYGQYLYPAGEYQAILITLGKGEGANWWCVLYPPLCFLDFSSGTANSKGIDEKKPKAKAAERKNVEQVNELSKNEANNSDKSKAIEEQDGLLPTKWKTISMPATNQEEAPKTTTENRVIQKTVTKEQDHTDAPVEKLRVVSPVNKEETLDAEGESQSITTNDGKYPEEKQRKKDVPVYVTKDEQPVKVKFFIVELWEKLFN